MRVRNQEEIKYIIQIYPYIFLGNNHGSSALALATLQDVKIDNPPCSYPCQVCRMTKMDWF